MVSDNKIPFLFEHILVCHQLLCARFNNRTSDYDTTCQKYKKDKVDVLE